MDELIAQVSKKTGLSPEHSRKAAETVLNFLKGRLPTAVAGQIDQVVSGGEAGDGGLGGIAKSVGGMLGKKS